MAVPSTLTDVLVGGTFTVSAAIIAYLGGLHKSAFDAGIKAEQDKQTKREQRRLDEIANMAPEHRVIYDQFNVMYDRQNERIAELQVRISTLEVEVKEERTGRVIAEERATAAEKVAESANIKAETERLRADKFEVRLNNFALQQVATSEHLRDVVDSTDAIAAFEPVEQAHLIASHGTDVNGDGI